MTLPITLKIFPLFTLKTKLCSIRLREKCFGGPYETSSPFCASVSLLLLNSNAVHQNWEGLRDEDVLNTHLENGGWDNYPVNLKAFL